MIGLIQKFKPNEEAKPMPVFVTQRNLLGLACYCLGSSDVNKPNLERTDRDTKLQLISRSSDSDWTVYTDVVFSSIFRALCVSC